MNKNIVTNPAPRKFLGNKGNCREEPFQHFFLCIPCPPVGSICGQCVTARTNASEPKLERMLYYEDTKLRRRKEKEKVIRGSVNKYFKGTFIEAI